MPDGSSRKPIQPEAGIAEGAAPNAPDSLIIEEVRTLSPADIREATLMLAHTFDESPIFNSAFPVKERRDKASRAIFTAVLKDGLRFGRVLIARSHGIVGVLIWYMPNGYPPTIFRKARLVLPYARAALADFGGLMKVIRMETILEHLHPTEPHIYVYFLGVARGGQGSGIGTALLSRGVREISGMNFPIYCDTQERSSVEWYRSFGFRVLRDAIELYRGGPRTWTLWRDAPHD